MNRIALAKELIKLARELTGAQIDRDLFKLYNKYERKPYLMFKWTLKDPLDNEHELWARFYIRHAEFIVVDYDLVGKTGMPLSLSSLQLKQQLPSVRIALDDDLEAKLVGATSASERFKALQALFADEGWTVGSVEKALNTGVESPQGSPRMLAF